MRGLVLGQLRQVHQHRIRRAEHDSTRQRRRAGIAGRQIVGCPVLADRLDPARLGVGDGDEPQIDQPPVMLQPDRVGRVEREARGRQSERRRLASHPCLHQGTAAAPLGLLGRHRHREGLGGDAGRVHRDAPRLDEGRVVILIRPRDLPFQGLRQFGLLAARQFQHVALAGGDQIVVDEGGDRGPAAHDEADHALGLNGVEAEVARQRGDRGARAFERGDGVALDRAPESGDVDPRLGQPGAQAEVPDECGERRRAQPSGQPVPEPPVRPVRPDVGQRREERVRPRVPCPGGAFRHMHHARAVDRGQRVVGRGAPPEIGRLEIRALDRVVPPAAREMRREALGRFRVEEHVGLVGPPVDGGTAQLGEPDRLRLRYPCGGRPAFHPARAVVVRVRPPGAQILVAEDPWLAGGAIRDGRPNLRGAIRRAGIEPVEAFAARDVRLQIGAVIDRGPALGPVEMLEPVAPVRQRHVVVDPDEIDLRIGPERVEVEEHVARAVARLVPEIFAPVRSIANRRAGPEDRADIGKQVAKGLHRRIGGCARADRRQPRHLGADQESIDPARRRAEMGVVQHHAPQTPVAGGPGP
ncbi:hypothetical protein ROE7235_03342 [Roseibaca ekhonensis]|uniref:Uncharacterized protein n=1 Tax=Roseinatronobacter ekhonensis TaxID=254356 RepID=A0A3B0MDU3_9RHOB|nr:hypothetical protein ROE7235_03342 [Roseibaca ekhonensis]